VQSARAGGLRRRRARARDPSPRVATPRHE
jgi:hypothetical protein